MQTAVAGTVGFPPVVKVQPDHQFLYTKIWGELADYRKVSPGEETVPTFLAVAAPRTGSTVIDFGCGTGRASRRLRDAGLFVECMDFAPNCLDKEVAAMVAGDNGMRFTQHDLTKPLEIRAEYGYCTDVLEHIPEESIDLALRHILESARYVFLSIATTPDHFGQHVGHPLHVCVHDYAWWKAKLESFDVDIKWSDETPHAVGFFVSAWRDPQEIVDVAVLNVGDEVIRDNVRRNTTGAKYRQALPHTTQDEVEVLILGGGPSLSAHLEEIREKRAASAKLICLNGTYKWALDNGLTPSGVVVVDARPFNKRFVEPVQEGCLYFLASQCDPSVYEAIPAEQIVQWHTMTDHVSDILNENLPFWMGVPGGSTVLLRAIPLLRSLGFPKFHLYGCDSCLSEDAHHAYAQPENDCDVVIPISCAGRIFRCHAWMAAQAAEWITMIEKIGETFDCQVHGDGLLAHIVNSAASLDDLEEADGV